MTHALFEAETWVAVAFVIFLLLVWRAGAHRSVGGALDDYSKRASAELTEAQRLKAEAEALLAQYKKKQQEAEAEAKAIVAQAKVEAEEIAADFPSGVDAIITNPPYDLATEFIEHALRLTEPAAGVVAMLLRTDFDHAKGRAHLFGCCPAFAKKVVLTKRIVWFEPEPGEKGKSPSFNHAWFVWDWRHEGAPALAYGP